MDDIGARILEHLGVVRRERVQRQADADYQHRVQTLKAYQQERFRRTYEDLLVSDRYRPAALFFLQELYGPADFTRRDEQFARIVGPMVRLFPREIVQTVETLAALHALSERLDSDMGRATGESSWSRQAYVQAWHVTGRADDRRRQLGLLMEVGVTLDRLTGNPLIRHSLRAMRTPAKAAGLAELQAFLEQGFDTFRRMRGAAEFLQLVQDREDRLCARLFAPDAPQAAAAPSPQDPLGQLP